MTQKAIEVSSHVSRDLLQNAAFFPTLPKVVWEYVSNSLDNPRKDIPVAVVVDLEAARRLEITDNGTGMSRNDLVHFFQMHGVNVQRKKGKPVRGRFGTGKSAAFGIAKSLRVDTVQAGKRNVVELHRSDIERAQDGEPFPVNELVVDELSEQEDGTKIEISDFIAKSLDLQKTIAYVEKNLARYKGKATVIVNGHECQFKEPPHVDRIQVQPPPVVEKAIGDVVLIVKVSPIALTSEESGVDILANGVWHETTLAELKGDQSDHLFGEVDVPILDLETDEIPAYDNTRNNQLNRASPMVVILLAWLHQELETIRKRLAADEQKRRRSEQVKKLARHAQKLAKILNDDFDEIMEELELARRIKARKKVLAEELAAPTGAVLPGDGDEPSEWQNAGRERAGDIAGPGPVPPGEDPRKEGPDLMPGDQRGTKKQTTKKPGGRRRGSFSIEFAHLTPDSMRSKYERETQTIYINLDHPQVASVLDLSGGSTEALEFLYMAYEIAGVEYAQAIQYERIGQGQQVDPEDALFSVGDTIDRITRLFSEVLSEG